MRKLFLTSLLGFGLSPALFANYTAYGPTQITPNVAGSTVNCLNIYFTYVCVSYTGTHTLPQRGDVIDIWSDGVYLGSATVASYTGPTPPTPPDNSDPVNPKPETGTFQVGAISDFNSN